MSPRGADEDDRADEASASMTPADGVPSLKPYVPGVLASFGERTTMVVDGTMVSADISGFTALSERLGSVGREGAEQLTDILNERFTRMIEAAHRCGGDVLKFGGDAVLVLFTGTGHADRAVIASKAMRAAVDDPVVSEFAGRVQLRMSIGVHSGEQQLLVTNPDHRELMVTGPGPTACVRAEAAAEAGQILLTPATAELVDPSWTTARVGAHVGVDLDAVPDVHGDLKERAAMADELLSSALPVAMRQRVQAGTRHGEHRLVATAFVRFSGTDVVVEREGLPALAGRLDELARVIASACRRYGVHWLSSDVNPDGGKIILTAGAPISTGNDETAVLRAVRDIIDADVPVDLHIGVNRGAVFVTDLGAPTRRSLTIMGDPVNLAARLTGVGGPNEIIASAAVLERCDADFDHEAIPEFLVKGRDEPVQASRVGALLGAGARFRFHDTDADIKIPLVGRDAELGQLLAARSIAEAGQGQAIELVGPAGTGKTRLLRELAVRSGKMRILTAAADPYLRSEPMGLMRPVIRQVMGVSPDADPGFVGRTVEDFAARACPEVLPLLPLAGPILGVELPPTVESDRVHPSFRRERAIEVVVRLAEVSLDEPAMFLFEDIHEADPASLDVLHGLVRGLSGRPWLFCLTRHDGTEGLADGTDVMELAPLDPGASRELIEHISPSPLTPAKLDRLVATSDGNPLFALELASIGVEDELPETLESLLAAQLDRLPPGDRLLLSDLAVLGVTAAHEVVDEVVFAGAPRSRQESTWVALRTFLDPQGGDGVAFRHSMVQRVAYEALAFARRRELHARAADVLVGRDGAATSVIAQHYSRAARHREAYEQAVAAADAARSTWATEEAVRMYRLALESSSHVPELDSLELGRIAESLGDTADVGGMYDEADEAYRRARKLVGDILPFEVRLQCKLGQIAEHRGRYPVAVRWYNRALRELENRAGDAAPALRIPAGIGLSGVRYRQGRFDDSIRWAERAEHDAIVAADESARARAGYLQVLAHTYAGSPAATHHRHRVGRMLSAIDDIIVRARCVTNLGVAAYFSGDWDECLRYYEQAVQTFDEAGDPAGRGYSLSNIGEVLSDRGDTDRAEEQFRAARSMLQAIGFTSAAGLVLSNLGRVAIRAGRVAEGIETQRAAIGELDRLGAHAMVYEARARLAEALLAEGSVSEAAALGAELLESGAAPTMEPLLRRLLAVTRPLDERVAALEAAAEAAADVPYEAAVTRTALLAARRAAGFAVEAADEADLRALLRGLGVRDLRWDPTVDAAGKQ